MMPNRLAWGAVLMMSGLLVMAGEFWYAMSIGEVHRIPTAHRIVEWIIIAYGAYLASPPVGR